MTIQALVWLTATIVSGAWLGLSIAFVLRSPPIGPSWFRGAATRLIAFIGMIVAASETGESYSGDHRWLVSYTLLSTLPLTAGCVIGTICSIRRRDAPS